MNAGFDKGLHLFLDTAVSGYTKNSCFVVFVVVVLLKFKNKQISTNTRATALRRLPNELNIDDAMIVLQIGTLNIPTSF